MTEPAPVFASGVDNERLNAQLRFILEVDKLKRVLRRNLLVDGSRRENSAEHSWHLTLCARTFAEYAPEGTDIDRVIEMLSIHDIVEIDAGDTYAYDPEGLKTQKAREEAAKQRIFSLLPADQAAELKAAFDEFEEGKTPEAKFAHAMDNLQPLLLNDSNAGGDWREHGVTADKVYARQSRTAQGSKALFAATEEILQKYIDNGTLPR